MIPTSIDPGTAPGTLVAVLYSEAGRALEVIALDVAGGPALEDVAERHALACSEGAGLSVIYDGDTGERVAVFTIDGATVWV